MTQTKKEKWIETEHQKAVQVHWDNLDRIKNLDSKMIYFGVLILLTALDHL